MSPATTKLPEPVIPPELADDDTDWHAVADMDPAVKLMIQGGIPLTRENYIDMKYGAPGTEDYPKKWTPEHEADMPGPFQR